MFPKRKAPPAATGGARGICQLSSDAREFTKDAPDLATFRAAWLARRCVLNPDLAILIAQLALGEVRA